LLSFGINGDGIAYPKIEFFARLIEDDAPDYYRKI
jgi:hypothetical protein